MFIPDPAAFPEEKVLVLNYRMRPAAWEMGEVVGFSFTPAYVKTREDGSEYHVDCCWHYDVYVYRPTRNPSMGRGGYILTVGDGGIRKPSGKRRLS